MFRFHCGDVQKDVGEGKENNERFVRQNIHKIKRKRNKKKNVDIL